VASADHYDLSVGNVTTGQLLVIHNPDVTGTSFTPSLSEVLTYGDVYTWNVGAVSAEGQVDVLSNPLSFTVQPVVIASTANLPANAASLVINGVGFSSNAASDTVTFSGGLAGTVTRATTTQLTVMNLSGLVVGDLLASVTVGGSSFCQQRAAAPQSCGWPAPLAVVEKEGPRADLA